MEWIIPLSGLLILIGLFATGWILGGRNREKSIQLKGLEDVTAHYEKMVQDFKAVDNTIDRVESRLSGLRLLPKRNTKVPTPQ